MSGSKMTARPLSQCLRQAQSSCNNIRTARRFTSSCRSRNEAVQEISSSTLNFDPLTVTSSKGEKALMRSGIFPIGSRRRRAALKTSDNVPFEQLPYQCFQEARKVLQEDREEKIQAIERERAKIARLVEQDPLTIKGGETQKQIRLGSMRRHLRHLKILADINDPLIKKRFEDGDGDMNKPIYRYLARKKWEMYQRKLVEQRINQLGIVPDLLPHFEPRADVRVAFKRKNVQPGDFVDSHISEIPARLNVQVFDNGERLVTIAVVDPDVPVVEQDNFTTRLHYLATNIPLSPNETSLPLSKVSPEGQLVFPWLPPFAQKGSPYHRLTVFVLQQHPGQTLKVEALKEKIQRDGFKLRSFVDHHRVQPIGVAIFRSTWDENTVGVMERAGIEGADIEFKRKRIQPLKPKKKPRGWEARHASAKYLSLRR